MKKYFIVSDVHGFYNELQTALARKGWDIANPDHIFVHCGDLIDRGPDAVKCLQFVNALPKDRKILIRGNHEDLFDDVYRYKQFDMRDISNGTTDTYYQIVDFVEGNSNNNSCAFYMNESTIIQTAYKSELWQKYSNSMVDFAEVGDNIFVHGWIPTTIEIKYEGRKRVPHYSMVKNWRNSPLWSDARWINGMEAWSQGISIEGKTIWCGHWHSSWGHANLHNDGAEFIKEIETFHIDPTTGRMEPHANHCTFVDDGIRAIDACTVRSHFVNCEVIEC